MWEFKLDYLKMRIQRTPLNDKQGLTENNTYAIFYGSKTVFHYL